LIGVLIVGVLAISIVYLVVCEVGPGPQPNLRTSILLLSFGALL
jgi:hypothetical protein